LIRHFCKQQWPWIRADYRVANSTALLGAVHGAKWSIKDCLIEFGEKRKTKQVDDSSEWLAWANAHNARFKK
jgi:hypothetical protein